jgi:hypothetical protein
VILVDSSVWIDFLKNTHTAQAEWLDANLGVHTILVGDLILAEVLQGFKDDRGFNEARRLLGRLQQLQLGGEELAIEAARNYRALRGRGITVRGLVDSMVATRCIQDGLSLLHSDRDFDPFELHMGLRVVKCEA